MTPEERKQQSEFLLSNLGVPIFSELPAIEDEGDTQFRSAQDIAKRILVLTYLSCIATQEDLRDRLTGLLKDLELWESVSPEEKALFEQSSFSEDDIDFIFWRGEAIWVLLWAINKVDKLGIPNEQADIVEVIKYLPAFVNNADFINDAVARPPSDFLDEADLLFRINWAISKAQPEKLVGLNLNEGVAYERYFALNWITGVRAEWDESRPM